MFAFLLIVVYSFSRTVAHGREKNIDTHRTTARRTFFLMVGLILFIEGLVRFNGGNAMSSLFFVHLTFAIPCFIGIIVLNFFLTGIRSAYHARIAYTTLALFLGTVMTGIPLIIDL